MKSIFYFLVVLAAAGFLQGCYTRIMWDPQNPETANYLYLQPDREQTVTVESYYPGGRNGGYSGYYDTPWWQVPSVSVNAGGSGSRGTYSTKPKEKSRDIDYVRTTDNNSRDNSTLPPATRNSSSTTPPVQSAKDNGNAEPKKRDAVQDVKEIRNNDGGRSTNKEKK